MMIDDWYCLRINLIIWGRYANLSLDCRPAPCGIWMITVLKNTWHDLLPRSLISIYGTTCAAWDQFPETPGFQYCPPDTAACLCKLAFFWMRSQQQHIFFLLFSFYSLRTGAIQPTTGASFHGVPRWKRLAISCSDMFWYANESNSSNKCQDGSKSQKITSEVLFRQVMLARLAAAKSKPVPWCWTVLNLSQECRSDEKTW